MKLNQFLDAAGLYLSQNFPTFNLNVETFNIALNLTNIDYFKQWCGLPEDWKPGQPVTRRGWQIAEQNSAALRPFIVKSTLSVNSGIALLPNDLIHLSKVGCINIDTGRNRPVELLIDQEEDDRLGDPVTAPTNEYPAYSYGNDHIRVYPDTIQNVNISYLRMPHTPVYVSSVVNGVDQYSNTSTEFEWPEYLHNDILRILIGYLSTAAKDQLALQVSQLQKQQGI